MINLGSIELPRDAATKTFAILAKKGAGKSYTAGVMEEEFYKNHIPFVVFDPIDIHWGIRFNKDGKSPGFPVVVFGVLENADITLTDDMGKEIAQAIVTKNISCILSTFGMSKRGQRKLITDFSEELLRINNTPRHIFIEEAHEYVPQRVGSDLGRCFAAVEALVVMGRNRGLGVTLINQRAATLNKDVLTQIDTLLAFRNVAPQDRLALKEWVEVHDAEGNFPEFWYSLASLPTGEGWIWSPEWLKVFQKVKIRERETLHPDRESLTGVVNFPKLDQGDIQDFIKTFTAEKDKEFSEKREANRKEIIKTFEVPNSVLGKVKNPSATEALHIQHQFEIKQLSNSFNDIVKEKDQEIERMQKENRELQEKLRNVRLAIEGKYEPELNSVSIRSSKIDLWLTKLPGGAAKVLQFLVDKHPMKFTRSQIALANGIKINTLNKNIQYMQLLKRNNMVIEEQGLVSLNPDLL